MHPSQKKRVAIMVGRENRPIGLNLRYLSLPDNVSLNFTEILGETSSKAEIAEQMMTHQLAIVAVGNAGISSYQDRMDGLLDAWLHVSNRPALLLLSFDPRRTQEAVDDWVQRQELPLILQAALKDKIIAVAETQRFLSKPEEARMLVEENLHKATRHAAALSIQPSAQILDMRVSSPRKTLVGIS